MSTLIYKKFLNEHAELGWQEVKTTEYIKKQLKDRPLKQGFNNTKVGLVYKVGNGKNAILLRADIDALKTAAGVRHTCGHTTHMAALIAAYRYAKRCKKDLNAAQKSIYFLFQPAEETFPSGGNAFVTECPSIINEISAAYAIHVRPLLALGLIGLQKGPLWARGDYMEIEVTGKMVHIKDNEKGIDALLAASHLIQKIKQLQANTPSIRIGIGVMEGGRQPNAVADYAILKGDIRLKSDDDQKIIKKKLESICNTVEKHTKARIKLSYFEGCPVVVNNPKLTEEIIRFLPQFKVVSEGMFSYGCEDFSHISQKVPSVIALIGTGDKYDLHQENCVISDQGTENAAAYFQSLIDMYCKKGIKS